MTVTVRRLGRLGDGVTDDGVIVPFGLPGEEVSGEIVDGRVVAPKIVRPSADRVRPPCPHFKSCGGCAMQHASDRLVESWKVEQVRHALAANGLQAPIDRVLTSPPGSRRRAVFSGRRTKRGALVGFHIRGSDLIIGIPDCRLLDPRIVALMPALESLTALGASRRSEVSLTVTLADAGADVSIGNARPLDGSLRLQAAGLAGRYALTRLTWDGELVAEFDAPEQVIDGIRVTPPAGAFLQATREGESALIKAVSEAVGAARHVADLFSGCGTFALPLARAATVHAVESGADLLAALDSAWRRAPGLKPVSTEARDLFRRPLLPDELGGYDAVVIDPPRAGAEAQTRELARSGVPCVAAVSCNPATFARDARILVDAGYGLNRITVIDQFRWSAHVELAAQFTRSRVVR